MIILTHSNSYFLQIFVVEFESCGDPLREIAVFWPAGKPS
jgi:hypothetical protein